MKTLKLVGFILLSFLFMRCEEETPSGETCGDGIQNHGETGVDCGGPCTACSITNACIGLTSVTDIDGNSYATIGIGTQCWIASNLKTTTYRDGTPIPHVDDTWDWWHLTNGAYCIYDDTLTNNATYGKLYNWYAVNTGKVCPVGWHVPTDEEWATLEDHLGEESTAGGKLKEAGFTHWQSPNTAATNETGFTGLPGGYISSTGAFFNMGYNGYWWCATEGSDTSYGIYRYLDFNIGFINRNEDYKVDGLSVRCVRD